jgi:hypothetical protein
MASLLFVVISFVSSAHEGVSEFELKQVCMSLFLSAPDIRATRARDMSWGSISSAGGDEIPPWKLATRRTAGRTLDLFEGGVSSSSSELVFARRERTVLMAFLRAVGVIYCLVRTRSIDGS